MKKIEDPELMKGIKKALSPEGKKAIQERVKNTNKDYLEREVIKEFIKSPKPQECKCKKRRWAHNGYCSECGLEVKDFLVKFVKLPSPIGWAKEFEKWFGHRDGKKLRFAYGEELETVEKFIINLLSQQRQSYIEKLQRNKKLSSKRKERLKECLLNSNNQADYDVQQFELYRACGLEEAIRLLEEE